MGEADADQSATLGQAKLLDYAFGVEMAIPDEDAAFGEALRCTARCTGGESEAEGWRALGAACRITDAVDARPWNRSETGEEAASELVFVSDDAPHATR